MPRSFHHQVRLYAVPVKLHALVDDVAVADAVEAVMPSPWRDEVGEGDAGAGIGHDRGARVLPEHNRGHKSDEAVSVDGSAGAVDDAAAVNVGVENDAEVCAMAKDGGAGEGHGGGVLGVGNVVGEHSVRLQVEAAKGVGAELVQNVPREKAAGAVSRIYYYLHTSISGSWISSPTWIEVEVKLLFAQVNWP